MSWLPESREERAYMVAAYALNLLLWVLVIGALRYWSGQ